MQAKVKEELEKAVIYKFIEPFIIECSNPVNKRSFGPIYRAADSSNNSFVSVNIISKQLIKNGLTTLYESLKIMVESIKNSHCDNVVSICSVKSSQNNIYIFQELCDSSLDELLSRRGKLPEAEALIIMRQLVNGYKWLYQHSFKHYRIEPSNILIKGETFKIADFGLASCFKQEFDISNNNRYHQLRKMMYFSPQMFFESSVENKVNNDDVWSMGVIFYQMLYGRLPVKVSNLQDLILAHKKRISFPHQLKTPGLMNLLQVMLHFDPKQRIGWMQIFAFSLFSEKEKIIKDIDSSISEAQQNSQEHFEMLIKANHIFFDQKKLILELELSADKQELLSEDNSKFNITDHFMKNLLIYNEKQAQKSLIRKIKNWFIRKHNKSVFLSHIILRIHTCLSIGALDLPLHIGEASMLVLSKWQCMITYKSYIRLKDGKANSPSFKEESYQQFIKCKDLCEQLKIEFKHDFRIMKMLLDQLIKKVANYLVEGGLLLQSFKNLNLICNQSPYTKAILFELYPYTIEQLQRACKQAIQAGNECRQILELAYLLSHAGLVTINQLKTYDFNSIYEDLERLTISDLRKRITQGKQ